jgi:hypothetical protein
MIDKQCKSKKGLVFFIFSLIAFAGLGLEALLAFLIEPLIYGKGLSDFSTAENIIHWIITCIIWFITSFVLIMIAKKKLNFDMFSQKSTIGIQRWVFCIGLLAISIVISVIDWNGFKVVKEFQYNGWLKFIFQYLYYMFETGLFVLIIVFAQHAGEIWFKKGNIPWGGIFVSLTWGLAHVFTKGDLLVGILSCLGGLFYGSIYIISKKNLFIAYPIILLMFVL